MYSGLNRTNAKIDDLDTAGIVLSEFWSDFISGLSCTHFCELKVSEENIIMEEILTFHNGWPYFAQDIRRLEVYDQVRQRF